MQMEIPFYVASISEENRFAEIRRKMVSIYFNKLDLSNSNLADAIKLLMKESHTAEGGFSFIVVSTPAYPISSKPLDLTLLKLSLPEALDAICAKIGYYWSCEGKIVIAAPDKFTKARR